MAIILRPLVRTTMKPRPKRRFMAARLDRESWTPRTMTMGKMYRMQSLKIIKAPLA